MTTTTHTIYRVKKGDLYLCRVPSGYYAWRADRELAKCFRTLGWARRAAAAKGGVIEISTTIRGGSDAA